MTTWDEMPDGTEDLGEALAADLNRMGLWPATPEVRHELAEAGFEVADCAPDGTLVPTMGPCAPRNDWRGHPVERRSEPR